MYFLGAATPLVRRRILRARQVEATPLGALGAGFYLLGAPTDLPFPCMGLGAGGIIDSVRIQRGPSTKGIRARGSKRREYRVAHHRRDRRCWTPDPRLPVPLLAYTARRLAATGRFAVLNPFRPRAAFTPLATVVFLRRSDGTWPPPTGNPSSLFHHVGLYR